MYRDIPTNDAGARLRRRLRTLGTIVFRGHLCLLCRHKKTSKSMWGDHMKCTRVERILGIAAVATALACCASNPAPNEKIAVAKFSVQRAEQAGAPESAPVEMATARDELVRAQTAAAGRAAGSAPCW